MKVAQISKAGGDFELVDEGHHGKWLATNQVATVNHAIQELNYR